MLLLQVGIPLGLVMFQSIGERLNKFASVVIRRAKCYLRCNTTEATEMNLMFATGMLSSIIITTGETFVQKYRIEQSGRSRRPLLFQLELVPIEIF